MTVLHDTVNDVEKAVENDKSDADIFNQPIFSSHIIDENIKCISDNVSELVYVASVEKVDVASVQNAVASTSDESLIGPIANLSKTAISSGLLIFSCLFERVGSNWLGMSLLTLVSVTSYFGLYFVAISCNSLNSSDFAAYTTNIFTKRNGKYPIYTKIFVNAMAPLIGFVKIAVASKAMKECTGRFYGTFIASKNKPLTDQQMGLAGIIITLIMSVVVITPLTFIQDMSKLALVSFVGVAVLFYILTITVVNYILGALSTGVWLHHPKNWQFRLADVYSVICTMLLCFIAHPSIPNVLKGMKGSKTSQKLSTMSFVSILICMIMYGATGFAGFNNALATPQDRAKVYITAIDEPGSIPKEYFHVGGLIISLVLCVTCPLVLFPARAAVSSILGEKLVNRLGKRTVYHGTNALIASSSIAAGLTSKNIISLTGAMGSVVGSFLVYVIPAWGVLVLRRRSEKAALDLSPISVGVAWFNLGFGALLAAGCIPYVVYLAIKKN